MPMTVQTADSAGSLRRRSDRVPVVFSAASDPSRVQVLSEYVEALAAGVVPNGLESLAEIHTHPIGLLSSA